MSDDRVVAELFRECYTNIPYDLTHTTTLVSSVRSGKPDPRSPRGEVE